MLCVGPRANRHRLHHQPCDRFLEARQPRYDLDSPHAHRHHALDEIDDVAWLAALQPPLVRVVDDAGILVGLDVITVDQPVDPRARAE